MEFLSSLHPVSVHFPIALITVYTLGEIFAIVKNEQTYYSFTLILLLSGMIGAVMSVLTGNQAMHFLLENANNVSTELEGLVESHESYANYFLWFYLFFTVLRVYLQISKKIFFKIRYILMILLIFGAFLTYETGRLGGLLVHKFGAGTELILGN
ncbi:MAG: hypothetical protein SCALA702_13240 [Melioribacteraceae bacterium]|nr:MAG: hypothetical protein SCALA702_13240 [Melioribacteraceae bacterium]